MPTLKNKIIITGTGRAGTTFLVELLTELGLDTGYTPATCRQDCHEHCNAGLERELEEPGAPYIVKSPAFCETLPGILARGRVIVDHALIPIRHLDEAALSRIRVGGNGRAPGGLRGSLDPAQQKSVLAENFHQLVETLAAHDIPHSFLHFPRFVQDAGYTYNKLRPLLGEISREQFSRCFVRVARPELIHSFGGSASADAGVPAELFSSSRRARRLRRYALRSIGACIALSIVWFAARRHPEEISRPAAPIPASAPWAARPFDPRASPHLFSLSSFPGGLPALSLTLTHYGHNPMFPRIAPRFFRNAFGPANFTPIAFQSDASSRLAPEFFFAR
jgi:hypothetical protein